MAPPPNHGYKPNTSYKPPQDFHFAPAYVGKIKSEKYLSPFDPRNLAEDDGTPKKQLWLVRLPPGASAEDLAGMQFNPQATSGSIAKTKVKGRKHDLVILPDDSEMKEFEIAVPSFDAGDDDGGAMVFGWFILSYAFLDQWTHSFSFPSITAPIPFSRYLSLVPSLETPNGIAEGAIPAPRVRKHPSGMGHRVILPIGADAAGDDLDKTLEREYARGNVAQRDPETKEKEKEKLEKEKKHKEKKDRERKEKEKEAAASAAAEATPTATPKSILQKRKDGGEKDSEKKAKKKVRISDA